MGITGLLGSDIKEKTFFWEKNKGLAACARAPAFLLERVANKEKENKEMRKGRLRKKVSSYSPVKERGGVAQRAVLLLSAAPGLIIKGKKENPQSMNESQQRKKFMHREENFKSPDGAIGGPSAAEIHGSERTHTLTDLKRGVPRLTGFTLQDGYARPGLLRERAQRPRTPCTKTQRKKKSVTNFYQIRAYRSTGEKKDTRVT